MWNETLENLVVVKRSGQRVDFNASKIAIAIKNAFDSVENPVDEAEVYKVFERVLKYTNDNYKNRKTINVEDIQDIIENTLKQMNYENVFLSFKEYRQKRAASRKAFNEKQQHKFVKVIERVQNESNSQNTNLTPEQLLSKLGKIISSEYTKAYNLDTKYVRALEEGNIYVHNLNQFSLGYIPYINLKLQISSDNHLYELLSDILNCNREISEEIGINSIDIILKKYILKHYQEYIQNMLKKYLNIHGLLEFVPYKKISDVIFKIDDITKSIEIFEPYNANQTLEYIFKIVIKDAYEDIKIFVGDTLNRMFNIIHTSGNIDVIYTISVSNNSSQICVLLKENIIQYLNENNYLQNIHVIFKINPDISDEYLRKIINLIINKKNIALSFIGNSYNKSINDVEYFANGMRIFENVNDNESRANGRMIVALSSINLARLGLKYTNKELQRFYEELDQELEVIKNELILQFETIGNKSKDSYNILFNGHTLGDERLENGQKIRKVIKNGNLAIGIIGLKECILCLEKDSNKEYDLLLKILNHLNKKCQIFSEETKLNFNICEPNDIQSRKYLVGIDKAIYGTIKGVTDKNMYDLIESAKFINGYQQLGEIQKLFKGGQLITISLNNKITNKQIMNLIKQLIDVDIGFVKMEIRK